MIEQIRQMVGRRAAASGRRGAPSYQLSLVHLRLKQFFDTLA
jgi:hypothetical protein